MNIYHVRYRKRKPKARKRGKNCTCVIVAPSKDAVYDMLFDSVKGERMVGNVIYVKQIDVSFSQMIELETKIEGIDEE